MKTFMISLLLAGTAATGAYAQMKNAEPRMAFHLQAGPADTCILEEPRAPKALNESLLSIVASAVAGDIIAGVSSATVGAVKAWIANHVDKNAPPPVVFGGTANTAFVAVAEGEIKVSAGLRCILLIAGERQVEANLSDKQDADLAARSAQYDPFAQFYTDEDGWQLFDYGFTDYPRLLAEFHVDWDSEALDLMKITLAKLYVREAPLKTGRRDGSPFDAYITLSLTNAAGGSEQAFALALSGLEPGHIYDGNMFSASNFWLPNPAAQTLAAELNAANTVLTAGKTPLVDADNGEINISAAYAQSRDPGAFLTFMSTVVNAIEPTSVQQDLKSLIGVSSNQ